MNILSYLLLLVNMKKVYFYYTFFYFFFLNSTIAPLKSPIHVSILITFVLLHFLHPFSSAGSSALFSASPSVFPHLLHSFGLSYVASSQSCPNASPSVFPHLLHLFASSQLASSHLCGASLFSPHLLHSSSHSLSYSCSHAYFSTSIFSDSISYFLPLSSSYLITSLISYPSLYVLIPSNVSIPLVVPIFLISSFI